MDRMAAAVKHKPHASRPPNGAMRDVLERALRVHRQGRREAAERLYRDVLRLQPAQPDALHYLGVLQHQCGHSEAAVSLIGAALERAPQYADAHNNLGNVHKECERLADAEACYRRALSCAPDHVDALANLGVTLEAQERLPEAFVAYAHLLEAAPHGARGHYLMGLFLRNHAENREHVEQAAELFRRTYELDDRWLCALHELGMTLYMLGRSDQAREVYRAWAGRDPANPVPRHMLAASGGAEAPARADDAYVRKTFDRFAENFDEQLLQHLHYRAPQALAAALDTVLPAPAATLDILDAGCGTGLCASLLRPYARCLAGVDLSAGMLEKARQRGGYDELAVAELTAFLQRRRAAWDAVVSADTLVYFGDLAPVLEAAHAALRPGGWLAFSLEALDDDGFELSASGRYRHGRTYVERTLLEAGYTGVRMAADSLRKEAGRPVASWVVLARRAPHGDTDNAVPAMQTEGARP